MWNPRYLWLLLIIYWVYDCYRKRKQSFLCQVILILKKGGDLKTVKWGLNGPGRLKSKDDAWEWHCKYIVPSWFTAMEIAAVQNITKIGGGGLSIIEI